jgi:hypothetical protein
MREEYNFNISLSVLNHLGRNLYRNVITVIGEAISNSWDADAQNVWIEIDRNTNTMAILDDGTGMNDEDFQNKFLKIGYSKRKGGIYKTPAGRPFIGRKGIGKLALLSCAKKIHIATKTNQNELVGGIIDNNDLDEAIKDDVNSQDYILKPLEFDMVSDVDKISSGTLILFEEISDGIINTIDYIKKSIALYFRFSLIDSNFNIYVNGELIDESLLNDFSNNTQFLWKINQFTDTFISKMEQLQNIKNVNSRFNIKGYIASVNKPSSTKIRGTQERATIDLFVNGRLREKDILRHIPTSRIVENYVYGQIHFDELDDGSKKDVFTSSREGIVSNEPMYKSFLNEIKRIFAIVIDDWDKLRLEQGNDGDPDNNRISKKERKGQELFLATVNEMEKEEPFIHKGGLVDNWVKELSKDAQFNIPSYAQCFISENLLRKYIKYKKEPLSKEAIKEAEKWRSREFKNKESANISYDVRQSLDDIYYLDMSYLSNFIDKSPDCNSSGLNRSAIIYKPLRDAVGHTSLLTDNAKSQLTTEYNNIQARLIAKLKAVDDNKD